ncbi:MAG: fibronectin type III domain-containing protein [Saprospiraceae bacterium]|nr:fibronectin type III domain-containing protein [Saprospiraceae bacterium]
MFLLLGRTKVGLRGASNSDFNNRTTTTNWSATTSGGSNSASCSVSNTIFPAAGLTFTWTPPSCLAPGGLNTTNITSTSATIGWTAVPSATGGYEWEIRTTGACGSGSPVQSGTTSSTSVNLSGLTANTTYTYCVRSICDGPSNSGWVSGSFTTQLVVAAPYNEPFTTTTTPAGYNITGWSIGSIRGVTGNPGNNIYKNLYSSAPNGTFTTVNIGPVASGMFLTFDYKTANYDPPYNAPGTGTGDFTVSISTDFGSNYTVISTIGNTNTNAWQQYSQDLSAYAGKM